MVRDYWWEDQFRDSRSYWPWAKSFTARSVILAHPGRFLRKLRLARKWEKQT